MKIIRYLNEIMNDHWENNKSLYRDKDGNETTEWKTTNRMNNKIFTIVEDYYEARRKKRKNE